MCATNLQANMRTVVCTSIFIVCGFLTTDGLNIALVLLLSFCYSRVRRSAHYPLLRVAPVNHVCVNHLRTNHAPIVFVSLVDNSPNNIVCLVLYLRLAWTADLLFFP